MENLHQTLPEEITTAQLRRKENYDKHRKPDPNLKSGDIVWFLPRNVKTRITSKRLDYNKMGPFKLIRKVGTSSYKLDLPASMTIHNTLHISLLELYEDNKFPSQISTPPPPIEIDGEPEYELEEIIHSRPHRDKLRYRARWTGYSPEEHKTWYPAQILKMPASPLNSSSPSTPRNQDWVPVTITRSITEAPPVKGAKTPTPPPVTAQDRWNDDRFLQHNTTPTSSTYSRPAETKEQRRAKKAALHPGLSWTECYNNQCPVYLDAKQRANWFLKKVSKNGKELARDMQWETAYDAEPGSD